MKSILLIFEDSEYERLARKKRELKAKTWKQMILKLI